MTSRTRGGPEYEARLLVARRTEVARDVVQLTLRHPEGDALPAWSPGAHVDLVPDDGPTRQYSLCGDPADRSCWQVAVLREPAGRGGSAYVHDKLAEGTSVRVRGPRNNFALAPADRYLFVAGGIGITPLLPMVAEAEAAGARWQLLYGGRSRTAMAFLDRLAALAQRDADAVRVRPEDETGLLDLDAFLADVAEGTLVYCCGPEPLLAAVEERCHGLPAGTLRVERFRPAGAQAARATTGDPATPGDPTTTGDPDEPGPAADQAADPGAAPAEDGAFEVVLARAGRTVQVPRDLSALEAIEAAGVQVLSSCREGTCGTCETDVLEGVPEHRDALLSPEERAAGETMMICVSRSRGRLVLDI